MGLGSPLLKEVAAFGPQALEVLDRKEKVSASRNSMLIDIDIDVDIDACVSSVLASPMSCADLWVLDMLLGFQPQGYTNKVLLSPPWFKLTASHPTAVRLRSLLLRREQIIFSDLARLLFLACAQVLSF